MIVVPSKASMTDFIYHGSKGNRNNFPGRNQDTQILKSKSGWLKIEDGIDSIQNMFVSPGRKKNMGFGKVGPLTSKVRIIGKIIINVPHSSSRGRSNQDKVASIH